MSATGEVEVYAEAVGCGGPDQDRPVPPEVDLSTETVISGVVRADRAPVCGAYVRLLDRCGEFAAEVVASQSGRFRFFAAPGSWTVRVLSPAGNGQVAVRAGVGVTEVAVDVTG